MGQAKRRGTFEERKALAIELATLERTQSERTTEIRRRRPSPKHVALMGIVAALMHTPNAEVSRAHD